MISSLSIFILPVKKLKLIKTNKKVMVCPTSLYLQGGFYEGLLLLKDLAYSLAELIFLLLQHY